MKQKAANKLKGLQGQQFNLIVIRRIPPSKGHLGTLQFDQPIVGESYPMRIPAQIVHHFFRMLQGTLTVNHPCLMIKIREESFKSRCFLQLLDLAWKPEFPGVILLFQAIQEFPSKQAGEHLDRDEEVPLGTEPSL